MGLINRLRDAVYRHSMQRLTQTFMTLSLADVSSRVSLNSAHEAEVYIRNMVCTSIYKLVFVMMNLIRSEPQLF